MLKCFQRFLRRACAGLCTAAVLLSCCLLSTVSAASTTVKTTDYLRLREGASTEAKVILVLAKDVPVTLLDNSNPKWAKVQTQSGKQGWCSKDYLSGLSSSGSSSSQLSSSQASSGSSVSGQTAVTTDYLNLREGTSLTSKVLLILGKGVSLMVLDNSNSQWVKVQTPSGKQGWCSRQYLTITGTASSSSSSPSSAPASSSVPSSASSSSPASIGGNGSSSDTRTVTGATVTADVLRLREQSNTSGTVLANLPRGTSLTVLDTSVSGWVKVKTTDGKTGFVSADFINLRYSDDPADGTSSDASALSLSSYSQTLPSGKTFFLKATVNPSYSTVSWSSSNESVATVANGYVMAVGKGSAVITALSGSYTATCNISVTEAEPVRTAYASPNTAAPGQTVTFTAITDTARDGVTFNITRPDGGTISAVASGGVEETTDGVTTKKWTASATLSDAGSYTVLAVSSQNGYYSSTGFTTSAYVSKQSDRSVLSNEERRVSDEMAKLIASWEGFLPSVSSGALGYGCSIRTNQIFYNHISQTEAWSMMINTINSSSYTSELNKMIQNNKFQMNQYQADALFDFGYNVGPGYFNSSTEQDFITIMKNAVVPPAFSAGTSYEATVTKDTVMREQSGSLSAATESISAGSSVCVIGGDFCDTRDGWYHVQVNGGGSGWINSGYVQFLDTSNRTHDLSYTNAHAFGTELIRWNQAGGKFYTGLFYRRLGEANVYNYGDYSALKYNKYNYEYPDPAVSLS